MAIPIDAATARVVLADALKRAEEAYRDGQPLSLPAAPTIDATSRLFASKTQAYREALVGCALARCVDERIDIRLPATEGGENAFSGRSLADQVVTPFLQQNAIPVSRSPYLSSLRGGARFIPGGAPRIQRDQPGFDALVAVVEDLANAQPLVVRQFLEYLLFCFVELREAGRINLTRVSKPNLGQLNRLIVGLLSFRSGGRFPALLTTAMFQTLSECHSLGWDVALQGINVADKASGAVGDITVRKGGQIILGVEVTERSVDDGRVTATFAEKVAPASLADYLFVTTSPPQDAALAAARSYTAVGHEMNFVRLDEWLINNLATIGPPCRAIFQDRMLDLLASQNADLKVAWNASMGAAIAN